MSADNTPPGRSLCKAFPGPRPNTSVTMRVDGDGVFDTGTYYRKHRHDRHASSRLRRNPLQADLSTSVTAAVGIVNVVIIQQPLGIDIQFRGELIGFHVNAENESKIGRGTAPGRVLRCDEICNHLKNRFRGFHP